MVFFNWGVTWLRRTFSKPAYNASQAIILTVITKSNKYVCLLKCALGPTPPELVSTDYKKHDHSLYFEPIGRSKLRNYNASLLVCPPELGQCRFRTFRIQKDHQWLVYLSGLPSLIHMSPWLCCTHQTSVSCWWTKKSRKVLMGVQCFN